MRGAARALAAVSLSTCLAVGLVACGDDDGPTGPLVGEIAPAIEALEAELGGPQDYFEVFADLDKVALWVATEDATVAVPYVWADGELSPVTDAGGDAAGETFTADDALDFDADTILATVLDDLGDNVTKFSIIGGPGDIVRYSAIVESDRGGVLEVVVDDDGTILESGEL